MFFGCVFILFLSLALSLFFSQSFTSSFLEIVIWWRGEVSLRVVVYWNGTVVMEVAGVVWEDQRRTERKKGLAMLPGHFLRSSLSSFSSSELKFRGYVPPPPPSSLQRDEFQFTRDICATRLYSSSMYFLFLSKLLFLPRCLPNGESPIILSPREDPCIVRIL